MNVSSWLIADSQSAPLLCLLLTLRGHWISLAGLLSTKERAPAGGTQRALIGLRDEVVSGTILKADFDASHNAVGFIVVVDVFLGY